MAERDRVDDRRTALAVRVARESQRNNPRTRIHHRHDGRPQVLVTYEEILPRLDEGVCHLGNLNRTLREASYEQGAWDSDLREGWVDLTHDLDVAIADPEESVQPCFDRLNQLSRKMSEATDLPNTHWPTYRALISSLRHIAVIGDNVASAGRAR